MEYSEEEIAYVKFCIEFFSCEDSNKRKCPIYESCYDENGECQGLCDNIPDKMKNGEILCERDRGIITFFQSSHQLKKDDCIVKRTDKPCPNKELCEERGEKEEKLICEELIQRIDLNAQKIEEKVIQKAIINNCPNEWCLKEKVSLDGYEKRIPEINGRTDIELKGETTATLYIVELKLRASREHVGQLASYVGWYKRHLPEKAKAVEDILLAKEFDKGALSALEVCPGLVPRVCNLRVDIENIQQV